MGKGLTGNVRHGSNGKMKQSFIVIKIGRKKQ